MTQEDKELLLKDLCARLPYNVKVHTQYNLYEGYGKDKHKIGVKEQIGILTGFGDKDNIIVSFEDYNWESYGKEDVKPYLRPMSSMTEKERKEYREWKVCLDVIPVWKQAQYYHWLNEHHFDYLGLIEKGLALEAHEGMYDIK